MNFRDSRRRRRADERLDMTPLIDVVFLLLIFFLITSNYVRERHPNIPIDAPTAATSEKDEQTPEAVLIHITREGRFFLERKEYEGLNLLEEGLRRLHAANPETQLLIRCDQAAPFGLSVQVMDLARAVGLKRFGIVTKLPE